MNITFTKTQADAVRWATGAYDGLTDRDLEDLDIEPGDVDRLVWEGDTLTIPDDVSRELIEDLVYRVGDQLVEMELSEAESGAFGASGQSARGGARAAENAAEKLRGALR